MLVSQHVVFVSSTIDYLLIDGSLLALLIMSSRQADGYTRVGVTWLDHEGAHFSARVQPLKIWWSCLPFRYLFIIVVLKAVAFEA